MGHGAGMDMQTMARDMRNRFWIALIFTIPIFIYSPMGGMFAPPAPPFGLRLDLWLFLLASVAVPYPSRSEEHTSELQSLLRTSYAVFCLKKKNNQHHNQSSSST